MRFFNLPFFLPVLLLPSLSPAAIISSTFSAGINNNWNVATNWSPNIVPNNDLADQYLVTIPNGALVDLNQTTTINQLNVGIGASVIWESGRTLNTVSGDVINNGLLELNGTSTLTRLTVSDPSDNLVSLSGTGTIRLTHTNQSITGVAPTLLAIGSNQRVEGWGKVSNNTVDLVNNGTLAGDSASGPLEILPKDDLENLGTVVAETGGSITLGSGRFFGTGTYRIDDGGGLNLTGATLEGMTLSVMSGDGSLFSNIATVTGNSTFKEFTNEVKILSNPNISINLGGDLTNNGEIELTGASTTSRIVVNDLVDQSVTIDGTGTIFLTANQQRFQGTSGSDLAFGAGQTVRGTGNIGANLLNLVNNGTIVGDSFGNILDIDPASTFVNSGSLRAESGGIVRFNGGTYTGAGAFIVSDASQFQVLSGTYQGITFTGDNVDTILENNLVSIAGNPTFDGITNTAHIDIESAKTLIVVDDLTNNGSIKLNGTSGNGRISINDTVDQAVVLGGTGTVELTDNAQNFTGTNGHSLTIGGGQTVHGTGRIGVGQLNLVNDGTIEADVSGQDLDLNPSSTFVNNGTVRSSGGGSLRFFAGSYSGGGSYLIGDSSSFTLSGGTYTQMAFTSDDQDATPGNNEIFIVGTTNFDQVTTDATLTKNAGVTMTFIGDVTNNGTITFAGTSGNDRISVNDTVDQAVVLDGTGSVELTNFNQNITGSNGHSLTIGADQTVHGTGKIGNNQLNLVNNGTIVADVPAASLAIDPTSTLDNPGTIRAESGSTVVFNGATYTGTGLFAVPDNGRFSLAGGTYQGLTFSNDGNGNGDLSDNDVDIDGTAIFENVTNNNTINVLDTKTLQCGDDITNNGVIELNGTSTFTKISIIDTVDQAVLIDGSGTIRLSADQQNITGSTGHLLALGAMQTLEGYGRVGINIINVANQGTIHANVAGQTIAIDPTASFSNSGELIADAGATINCIGTGHTNEATGTISGNGSITTTSAAGFTNDGTISPGASIGSLTIEDMTHTALSKWQFEIESTAGPGTGHDALHVDGDLDLNGLLIPQLLGGFIPNPSDSFVIITASGDISGNFTGISQPAGGIGTWNVTVDTVNDQVVLDFTPDTTIDFAEFQNLYFTPTQIGNGDADPDADFDQDGLNTFMEWIHNFDPTSPAIPVAPLSVEKTGSSVILTFPVSTVLPPNSFDVEVLSSLVLDSAPFPPIPSGDYTINLPPDPGVPTPYPNINLHSVTITGASWINDPARFFQLHYFTP